MEKRMCEEWEIIGAVKVGEEDGRTIEVVMGYRETRFGKEWVTWECTNSNGKYNYYWGHYYRYEKDAYEDLAERISRVHRFYYKEETTRYED